jgi:hypothetical protein
MYIARCLRIGEQVASKKKKKPYLGRDELMIKILKGATKSGVQKDQKKERDKNKCRKPVKDYDND